MPAPFVPDIQMMGSSFSNETEYTEYMSTSSSGGLNFLNESVFGSYRTIEKELSYTTSAKADC